MHSYYVVKSICEGNNLTVRLVAGASENNATFVVWSNLGVLYGACRDNYVTLNLINKRKTKSYDLHDPESIQKITKHILENTAFTGESC